MGDIMSKIIHLYLVKDPYVGYEIALDSSVDNATTIGIMLTVLASQGIEVETVMVEDTGCCIKMYNTDGTTKCIPMTRKCCVKKIPSFLDGKPIC